MSTILHLSRDLYPKERTLLLEHGGIEVHQFKYRSGVEALHVHTGTAQYILLPFKGQQIWDAWVGGRRLTMQSVFDEPVDTREFRRTYGAFFVHCGGTAIGSPQNHENHLPHGELPNIPFDTAHIILGEDNGQSFIELSGLATEREAFSHAFEFRPTLRVSQQREQLECAVQIKNIGGDNMPCMYLGHVNFKPIDGTKIIDGADDALYQWSKPAMPPTSPGADDWHDTVAADFSRHRNVQTNKPIEPEFATTMVMPADATGWAHAMAVHDDGGADFVSWQTQELPYAVRWMTQAPERQAMGFALPSTARPEGREAARVSGELNYLARGQTFQAKLKFGVLRPLEAQDLAKRLHR